MEIISTPLSDCYIIKTQFFGDDRGFFLESYNQKKLQDHKLDFEVLQINFAKSRKNVLRGLHYQKAPFAQSKLVGVIAGEVIDVVVDMRQSSPTFKQHFKLKIDSPDIFLLIPKGFAHGYYTLANDTIFYYAVDQLYSPENEHGVLYSDPALNIDWEYEGEPIVSMKDQQQPLLSNAALFD